MMKAFIKAAERIIGNKDGGYFRTLYPYLPYCCIKIRLN
jgi:hypothetical protein